MARLSGEPEWGRRSISCATCASGCISKNWTRAKRWYRTIALFAVARSYPDRVYEPATLISGWKKQLKLSDRVCDIMRQALASDKPFLLAGFQVRATERIMQCWQDHQVKSNTVPAGPLSVLAPVAVKRCRFTCLR
ncbi:hypothetical protein AB2E84_22850 [Escherichia coli]